MLVLGTPIINSQLEHAETNPIVHSVRGYLAFCQNQIPELDIEYIITNVSHLKLSRLIAVG